MQIPIGRVMNARRINNPRRAYKNVIKTELTLINRRKSRSESVQLRVKNPRRGLVRGVGGSAAISGKINAHSAISAETLE